MLIFQCFVELITELGKGNQREGGTDRGHFTFLVFGQNVNIPPIMAINIL